jgi:hypothetical protein
MTISPNEAQTGPAKRNDITTIEAHHFLSDKTNQLFIKSLQSIQDHGKSYKELMNDITTFIFDVDGVLTDSSVLVTRGEILRTMNIRMVTQ